MSDDIRDIWSFPKAGAVLDLSERLAASDLDGMFATAGGVQAAVFLAEEEQSARTLDRARAVAADLKAKGIPFDVDRMIRGSLLERAQIWWDDRVHNWQTRNDPEPDAVPADAMFAFDLPVALTYSTNTLNADYDAIDTEVARMVEGLSRQITVSRGAGPRAITVPDTVVDELAELDDWSEDQTALVEAADITAYWPPVAGAPALALSVVQEDGGHLIEVKLLAHGPLAHRRFVALLKKNGGRLD